MIKDFWLTPCPECINALDEAIGYLLKGESVKMTIYDVEDKKFIDSIKHLDLLNKHKDGGYSTHIEINDG